MIKSLFLDNRLSITNTLIYLFPAAILGRNTWGASILIGLTIIGLIVVCQQKINPFRHEEIKLISIISTVYFCTIIIFSLFSEKAFTTLNLLGGELFYLCAPFIALSIYRSNFDFDKLIFIIKLCLILLGLIVLYRSTKTVVISDRVLWVSHIGIMLLVISWINIGNESKYSFLFTLISSTLALNAIILAGTRGPVLVYFANSIVFLFLNSRYSQDKHRNRVFSVLLVFITAAILVLNPISKQRFTTAVANINIWIWGGDSGAGDRRFFIDRPEIRNV